MTARPGCWPRAVRAAARTATSVRRVLERALPSMIWAVIGGLGGGQIRCFSEGRRVAGSLLRQCGAALRSVFDYTGRGFSPVRRPGRWALADCFEAFCRRWRRAILAPAEQELLSPRSMNAPRRTSENS